MTDAPGLTGPLARIAAWLEDARAAGIPNAEAMALATAADGQPSVRFVLLRGVAADGLRFYTNRRSRKADEIAACPRAAIAIYWDALGRQVRAEGPIAPVSDGDAAAYFRGRPRGHQLASWASPQSQPIARAELLARYAAAEARFAGREVDVPPDWAGYRLAPTEIELWTRVENRLHERERFRWDADAATWRTDVIAP